MTYNQDGDVHTFQDLTDRLLDGRVRFMTGQLYGSEGVPAPELFAQLHEDLFVSFGYVNTGTDPLPTPEYVRSPLGVFTDAWPLQQIQDAIKEDLRTLGESWDSLSCSMKYPLHGNMTS